MPYDPTKSLGTGKMGQRPKSSLQEYSVDSYYSEDLELEAGALQIPKDIIPPSPPMPRQTVNRVPFLFTSLAKKAFHVNERHHRPGALDLSGEGLGPEGSAPFSPSAAHSRKDELASKAKGRSGRSSAPPMTMAQNTSNLSVNLGGDRGGAHSVMSLVRKSMTKNKKANSTKKRPELWILEAEQRQVEGIQKAEERENFERQKGEVSSHIVGLTKQFNDLRKQRIDMEREFALLLDRKAVVDAESKGDEFRKAQADALRIQDLEAKLEYWTQALREEEAYTKTLMHMQARSADEKHKQDIETAKFKKEAKNYEHDLHALLVRLQDAKNERDAAEQQVRDYVEEMTLYQDRREARLDERRRTVQKLQRKEEALKRMMAVEEEIARQRNISKLKEGDEEASKARQREKFRVALEEGFQKIMSITGIRTVEELEQSFLKRDEKRMEFENMLEHRKNRINDLTDIYQDLHRQLAKVKYSGSANDAERNEVEEVEEAMVLLKRKMAEKKRKLTGQENILIKVRSGFEYLASKLQQVEMDPAFLDEEEGTEGQESEGQMTEGQGAEAQEAKQQEDDEDAAQDDEDHEEAEADVSLDNPEHKAEMKKVEDPKTGVAAVMKGCHEKLSYVYRFLEANTQGVPPQSQDEVSDLKISNNLLLGLVDLQHNFRIPMDHKDERRTPRRTEEDDAEELEDRSTLKVKSERFLARKKREQAARFDEFGNEIIPSSKPKADIRRKK